MKLNETNILELPVKDYDKNILLALLEDLKEINKFSERNFYIDWQDYHNEYSPERTDPCPDYYGYYTIHEDSTQDRLGTIMDLFDLDSTICFLYNLVDADIIPNYEEYVYKS